LSWECANIRRIAAHSNKICRQVFWKSEIDLQAEAAAVTGYQLDSRIEESTQRLIVPDDRAGGWCMRKG